MISYMKKAAPIGIVSAIIILVGVIGSNQQPTDNSSVQTSKDASITEDMPKEAVAICDGKKVVADCTLNGVVYEKYISHPAVAEKTHTETTTTYKEEVTGYCTLCNDGTYSPTCATGRGACSWHGGVAEWGAPMTSQVPVESTRVVVDTPAKNAYIEKIRIK